MTHPTEAKGGAEAIAEFVHCLNTMSHSRAGRDYELPPAQKAKEDREERQSLACARAIWANNPDLHDDLRAAFAKNSPLATMCEIEAVPPSKAKGA